jgi:hypothetical protein
MTCTVYFDFLLPHQFATEPRFCRSKKRDKEFELVKVRGQERRIVVSPYGEILFADIPLYEALIMAGYAAIAVVVVVGCAKPADIKAAKALSAKDPLPVGDAAMPSGAQYAKAVREFTEYLSRTQNP